METREFWRQVRVRAWSDTKTRAADHAELTMLGMIVAVAAVFSLWFTLGETPASEEVIPRLVGTAAVLLLLAWTFLSRLLTIPAEMYRDNVEALSAAKNKIIALTSTPERMAILDFAALAAEKYGWNFQKEEELQFFDFIDGIRHAVNDDDLELEGRPGCMDHPEDRKNFYFLEPVSKDHVKKTQIDVPGFLKGETSNYDIHTWSYSDTVSSKELYRDIHVSNRAKAITWLEGKANNWKGQRVKANEIKATRSAQFMRELREQGISHTVEDGTMQGRVWKSGDPPEGEKIG